MYLNVGIELSICDANRHLFRAQFQTQACFESSGAAWVPKHLRTQRNFFSLSIQLKLRKIFQISSLKVDSRVG